MILTIITYIIVGVTCFLIGRVVEWGQNMLIIKEYEHMVKRYANITDEYERMVQQSIQNTTKLIQAHRTTDPQLIVVPQRPYTLH